MNLKNLLYNIIYCLSICISSTYCNTENLGQHTNTKKLFNLIKQNEKAIYKLRLYIDSLHEVNANLVNTLNEFKTSLSNIVYSLYRLNNYYKYGVVHAYEIDTVTNIIIIKNLLQYFHNQKNAIIKKIKDTERSKMEVNAKITAIQKQINSYLSNKHILKAHIKKRDIGLTTLDRYNKIHSMSNNLDELLQEFEAEEYVGFLNDDNLTEPSQKTDIKISVPCFGKMIRQKNSIIFQCLANSVVFAPESGTILFFGILNNEKILIIKHSKLYKSVMSGVGSLEIPVGNFVYKNQVIGYLPNTVENKKHVELKLSLYMHCVETFPLLSEYY